MPAKPEVSVSEGDGGLDEGEIHDILRNDRRRLSINSLQAAEDGELSVRDLSEEVATRETGENPPPRNKRQSVYVSLHQTHLPKLDKHGIVEYDSDSKTVRLLDRVREVEIYMEVVPRYGLSWGEFYFGLAFLGLLTTIAVLIGVPVVDALGVTAVASFFFLVLMTSAAYHVYSQQDRILFQRFRSGAGAGGTSGNGQMDGDVGGGTGNANDADDADHAAAETDGDQG